MANKVQHGVQATPADWKKWDACAEAQGLTRQEWIRHHLNAAAEKLAKKKGGE